MTSNALLTTTEAARIIGWSKNYLLSQRLKGVGPTAFVIGPKRIRYLLSDVLDWLESRRSAPKKAEA